MNSSRVAGAVTGGLVAGLALSAFMLVVEKRSGKPSELIELERSTAAKLGLRTPTGDASASVAEQAVTRSVKITS